MQGHGLREGQKLRRPAGSSARGMEYRRTPHSPPFPSPLASSEFVSTALPLDRHYLVNIFFFFAIKDLSYYLSCNICNFKISLQKEGKF